jgi:CheY-like chemotaxis protein
MDIQMPNMNGYDAARKLREMGLDTPIVAVTASALAEEQNKAIDAGMNQCLTKPFKKKDLLPVLDRWLVGGGAGSESTAASELAAASERAPNPQVEETVLDFRRAVQAFMGREDVVRSVLASFLKTAEGQIARLQAALKAGELEELRQEAHSLKGGAWNLAADPLGEAARQLEEAAKAGEVDRASTCIAALQGEFVRLKSAAEPYVG